MANDSDRLANQGVPESDKTVEKLENQIVEQRNAGRTSLTTKMAKVSIGSSKRAVSSGVVDYFPPRPAYGNKGVSVLLWTNYIAVEAKVTTYFKYTMKFSQRNADGSYKVAELRGRKLELVVRELINDLSTRYPKMPVATEFKSQVITTEKLPIDEIIATLADGQTPQVFKIEFNGPTEARVGELNEWLSNMAETPDEHVYPRFPETIDAFNVIFGFGPRSLVTNSAVGSARIFPFANPELALLRSDGRPLAAARGLFHSLRPATGRMLLNVNPTHGVFKRGGPVAALFNEFGVRPMTAEGLRGPDGRRFKTVIKFLPKTRVQVDMRLDNGKTVTRNKAIFGLACKSEIERACRHIDKPPRFTGDVEYPGPKHVSFWLDAGQGKGGKYITVFEYFKQSKKSFFML